ncbi:mycofactocin biosynthesis FMN-dependent deaminase MftD [Leucobacter allii]|uniref:Mycofactocin biosynthesis FMN-dependent deaminase MftD n=1 Tax=Leucobacter allii TaxID=2932247 RepID=A0ABY4FMN9_9MICO|nr:pre-mycofactocin synthase MftD [Leucobacter allii]UOQ57543.1 mycofactocin biosynthesis FMN-dependent deaminase MftD [Leucobacter allii]UOR01991.1 mycofactocin biosynthesis FMN-dependent deaminase MftD [Leucobacter allii]
MSKIWPWVKNPWFETVLEAQRRSKAFLPPSVYAALVAGSERGRTPQDNLDAFAELEFAPHVAGHQPERELSTTILGIPVSMPVMISPTGVQAIRPEGEVAVARAAANRGTIMGLSSFASKPVEEVAAANENTFFQMYWTGTRDAMLQRMERARAAGAKALITTTDWSFSIGRDWGSPAIPERMDFAALYKMAPEGVLRPSWTLTWLKAGLPDLTAPNLKPPSGPAPTFFGAYGEWSQTPPPSWEDLEWLREAWGGPFMVKGITRIDDAKRAVDIGADAISVSNHGGNNLDTTPAAIRCLGPIADAVGDQLEVLLDGGVRRGGDVAKALALGARAVMIGRAYLWGLGANGQTGVENVLDLLRMGLDSALIGLGHKSISELSRDDFHIPEGFERVLGDTGEPAPDSAAEKRRTPRKPAAERPVEKTIQ